MRNKICLLFHWCELFWENLYWIWLNICWLFTDCSSSHLADVLYMLRDLKKTETVHWFLLKLSLAVNLWNPFWLRHQSDILELLFLANSGGQAGLMSKLILMPHSTDGHPWLPTEDSHSCNLGEPIWTLRKYLFHSLTERKSEIYQFRFALFSFLLNYYPQGYLFFCLWCRPLEAL